MYTLRTVAEDLPSALSAMQAVKEIGYEAVQIAGSMEVMENYISAAKTVGVKIMGILTNPQVLKDNFKRIIEMARQTGASDIGISSGARDEAAAREVVCDANELARAVRAEGFTFSYHNHSHEYMRTECGKRVMDILLEGFDKDLIDLMPDTYWLQHGGVDVRDFIETYAERIKILHLKDMKRVADGVTFSEVGEGNLNMKGIIKCALENGISTFIVEQDLCDGNPVDSARISYKNISKILGEG